MNTFESEKEELRNWIMAKNKWYDEESKKTEREGLDGVDEEVERQHRLHVMEFNKRLTELKAKYGKE